MLDFTSLLVAVGFSAAFLSVILIAGWKTSRSDGFLLTSAAGAILIVAGAAFTGLHIAHPEKGLLAAAFALMLVGLTSLYGAAGQYRFGRYPSRTILLASLIAMALTLPAIAAGFGGAAFFIGYLAAAGLLALTAHQYWNARAEAPATVMAIAILYYLIGLSFLARAAIVMQGGQWRALEQPSNWAEIVSLVLVVASIPALGAMTTALSQFRKVRTYRQDALTDPLTGLMNRRALFEAHEGHLPPSSIAVLFDIDEFKAVNDAHGHAMGDRVIVLFAQALIRMLPARASAARIGGEEFALILRDTELDVAIRHTEDVRARFAALARTDAQIRCTVSAGLAASGPQSASTDRILAEADRALYEAKRAGRDRVTVAPLGMESWPSTPD